MSVRTIPDRIRFSVGHIRGMTATDTTREVDALLDPVALLRRAGRRAEAIALLDRGVTVVSGAVVEMEDRLRSWEEDQLAGGPR